MFKGMGMATQLNSTYACCGTSVYKLSKVGGTRSPMLGLYKNLAQNQTKIFEYRVLLGVYRPWEEFKVYYMGKKRIFRPQKPNCIIINIMHHYYIYVQEKKNNCIIFHIYYCIIHYKTQNSNINLIYCLSKKQ